MLYACYSAFHFLFSCPLEKELYTLLSPDFFPEGIAFRESDLFESIRLSQAVIFICNVAKSIMISLGENATSLWWTTPFFDERHLWGKFMTAYSRLIAKNRIAPRYALPQFDAYLIPHRRRAFAISPCFTWLLAHIRISLIKNAPETISIVSGAL